MAVLQQKQDPPKHRDVTSINELISRFAVGVSLVALGITAGFFLGHTSSQSVTFPATVVGVDGFAQYEGRDVKVGDVINIEFPSYQLEMLLELKDGEALCKSGGGTRVAIAATSVDAALQYCSHSGYVRFVLFSE